MGFRSALGSIRPGRAQKPHTRPKTSAPAPKKIYTELYTSMALGALKERSMDVSVWECLKQNMVSRRQIKREKMAVGPGPGKCKTGHKTSYCGELRVRWSRLCAFKGGAEHERVKVVLQTEQGLQKTGRTKVMVRPGSR